MAHGRAITNGAGPMGDEARRNHGIHETHEHGERINQGVECGRRLWSAPRSKAERRFRSLMPGRKRRCAPHSKRFALVPVALALGTWHVTTKTQRLEEAQARGRRLWSAPRSKAERRFRSLIPGRKRRCAPHSKRFARAATSGRCRAKPVRPTRLLCRRLKSRPRVCKARLRGLGGDAESAKADFAIIGRGFNRRPAITRRLLNTLDRWLLAQRPIR